MPVRSNVRFRRRVVLEMLPDENELLQRLAAAHGSIRGTILSALRLLETDESDTLRARVVDLEAKLAKTKDQAATAKSRLKDDEAGIAKVGAELTNARTALREAQTLERQTKAALTKLQARAAELKDEAALLRDLQIRYLYCADCGKFIGEDEWAEQPVSEGVALLRIPANPNTQSGVFERSSVGGRVAADARPCRVPLVTSLSFVSRG